MAGKHSYRTALPRKSISFPGKLRKEASATSKPAPTGSGGAYAKLKDQDLATTPAGRRRASSGIRAFRLGGRRVRTISWRLRPKFKFLSLRFVSPTFLLRKLKQAYLNLMRVEGRIDLVEGDRICVTYSKAVMAYIQRTSAEGRFYRNGIPILDIKDL